MAGSQSFDPQFFAKFKNAVIARANKSGNQTPNWGDVWMAMAEMSETASTLEERGITAKSFFNDLLYTQLFGRPAGVKQNIEFEGVEDIIEDALEEIKDDIKTVIKQAQGSKNADYQEAVNDVKDHLDTVLDKNFKNSNKAGAAIKDDVKKQIVKLLNEQLVAGGSFNAETVAGLQRALAALESMKFQMGGQLPSGDSPIAKIEKHFTQTNVTYPAASQVVDYVLSTTSDEYTDYLQYRNGKTASEKYKAPVKLPNKTVIASALIAHEQASALGVTSVKKEHIALALLTNPVVIPALLAVAKDQKISLTPQKILRLHKELQEKLSSVAPKGEKLRRVVKVSPELKDYVSKLDGEDLSGEFAAIKVFARLLEDKEISNIIKATEVMNDKERGVDPKLVDLFPSKVDEFIKEAEDSDLGKDKVSGPIGDKKVSDQDYNEVMSKFTTDLCKEAVDGRLDPVLGRETEVEQVKEVLLRKGRKNPMLVGEPGTGKTALAAALAQDIVAGNVPERLKNVKLVEVDMNAVMAGTAFRGELEQRLQALIEGTAERNRHSDEKTILFIDEMRHALNQGGGSGGPNIGEMLLGHLTNGDLMVMGSLTEDDFYKSIKQNGALERRFTPVLINEPTPAETVEILKGLQERFEEHHGVKLNSDHFEDLVAKSRRYVIDRFNPDNSIETLDSAMAAAAKAGEKELSMDRIIDAIAHKAKMDPQSLKVSDAEIYLNLEESVKKELFGQDPAVEAIAGKLQTAKAGLRNPNKPLGSFLLMGPTGTGKTEIARCLAKQLFRSEANFTRIDMAEYQDQHAKSRLVGAPPGYVGYGNDGELTKAVRRTPHSIILLDEFEKAHPDVQKLLLGVLEEGSLTDGMGMKADFSNTIILCTSNLGAADVDRERKLGRLEAGDYDKIDKIYQKVARSELAPEFINRLDQIVSFNYISDEVARLIAKNELKKLGQRIEAGTGAELVITEELIDNAVEKGFDPAMGGRGIQRSVETMGDKGLARWMLENAGKIQKGDKVYIDDILDPQPKLVKAKDVVDAAKVVGKKKAKAGSIQRRRRALQHRLG